MGEVFHGMDVPYARGVTVTALQLVGPVLLTQFGTSLFIVHCSHTLYVAIRGCWESRIMQNTHYYLSFNSQSRTELGST